MCKKISWSKLFSCIIFNYPFPGICYSICVKFYCGFVTIPIYAMYKCNRRWSHFGSSFCLRIVRIISSSRYNHCGFRYTSRHYPPQKIRYGRQPVRPYHSRCIRWYNQSRHRSCNSRGYIDRNVLIINGLYTSDRIIRDNWNLFLVSRSW